MPIRTTESMTERENLVCQHIEKAFRTTIIRTGYLDDFDFYGVGLLMMAVGIEIGWSLHGLLI